MYAQLPGGAGRFGTDIYIIDRQRTITRISPERGPAEVTSIGNFTPDGKSVVLSLTCNHKTNLYEVPLDGSAMHQLTFGDGPDLSADVSRDGTLLVYDRDSTSGPLFVSDASGSRQLPVSQRLEFYTRIRPVTDDLLIAERLSGDGMALVAVDVATGEARKLVAGRLPIVMRDGKHVVFTPLDDRAPADRDRRRTDHHDRASAGPHRRGPRAAAMAYTYSWIVKARSKAG